MNYELIIRVTFQPDQDGSELTSVNQNLKDRLQKAVESMFALNAHLSRYVDEVRIEDKKERER